MSTAQAGIAEPAQNAPPTSYRDLLESVPDALNGLKADDPRLGLRDDEQAFELQTPMLPLSKGWETDSKRSHDASSRP